MDSTKEEEESSTSRPLKVMFAGPAKHWTVAAPVGNGRLGAMISGGVGTETLQLNGSLSFTVSLDSELQHHSSVNAANRFIMDGSCPGKRNPPKENASEDSKGIQFSAIVVLQIGGNAGMIHIIDDTKLKVESSDWAVLVLAASSSFEGPFMKPSDSKKDPKLTSLNTLN